MNKGKQVKEQTLAQKEQKKQHSTNLDASQELKNTVAGEIWEAIKNRSIEYFALPDQKVYMHCQPITIEPSKLYLLTDSSSVLPMLENALGKEFLCERLDKYVVVSKIVNPFEKK